DGGGQLPGVHKVAVVTERDRVHAVCLEHRLRVVPGRRAGRRVSGVPDGEVAVQRGQGGLVEHLADQPKVLVDQDVAAVGDRDTRRFLPAVLLGEQTEVREPGDVVPGGPDAEQPALFLGGFRSHRGTQSTDGSAGSDGPAARAATRAAARPRRKAMPRVSSTSTTEVTIATGRSEGGCSAPTVTVAVQVTPSSASEDPTILHDPDETSLDTAPGAWVSTWTVRRPSVQAQTAVDRGAICARAVPTRSLVTVNA